MQRILKSLILLVFAGQFVWAQTNPAVAPLPGSTPEEHSLLWQISGNGLSKPSYLFGTIHIVPQEDYHFSATAQKALKSCQKLVLETDIEMTSVNKTEVAMMTLLPDGKTLDGYIPADQYQQFNKLLDSLGVSKIQKTVCMHMKPIFATAIIIQALYDKTESYETNLLKMAKKSKLEFVWLESVTYQLEVLNQMTMEEQIASFGESLTINTFKELYAGMVKAHKAGDIDALHQMMLEESASMADFEERLLNQRNRNWVPVISKYVAEGPSFIAVGAGHLGGERGVISLLRQAGYTVTAVK